MISHSTRVTTHVTISLSFQLRRTSHTVSGRLLCEALGSTTLTIPYIYTSVGMAPNPSQHPGLFQNAHNVFVTNSQITEVGTGFNIIYLMHVDNSDQSIHR